MFETITRDLEELGGMWTHKNLNLSFLRSKSKHKNSKPSDKTKLVFSSINFKKQQRLLPYIFYYNLKIFNK